MYGSVAGSRARVSFVAPAHRSPSLLGPLRQTFLSATITRTTTSFDSTRMSGVGAPDCPAMWSEFCVCAETRLPRLYSNPAATAKLAGIHLLDVPSIVHSSPVFATATG